MNILIAPDSFKETLTAYEVADVIQYNMQKALPDAQCTKIPLADGGEGTAQILTKYLDGTMKYANVEGADGSLVNASFGVVQRYKCAFIDCASVIGLEGIPHDKRNPLNTSSYGLGELLKIVHQQESVDTIVVGLGGSATVDGGIGMAQALGVKLCNENGVSVGRGGKALECVYSIDKEEAYNFGSCKIVVASDVKNPLLGENGAVQVFAPQKGATPDMVKQLEYGMNRYARILYDTCNNSQKTFENIIDFSGAGAAGGLGMAFSVFCGAEIRSGIELVLDYCNFDEKLQHADVVITGEGKIDGQSIYGKVPYGVMQHAKKYKIPVIVIAGMVDESALELYEHGMSALFSCTMKNDTWDGIKQNAKLRLGMISYSVGNLINMVQANNSYNNKGI